MVDWLSFILTHSRASFPQGGGGGPGSEAEEYEEDTNSLVGRCVSVQAEGGE